MKMSTSDFLVTHPLSLNTFYVQTSGGDTKAQSSTKLIPVARDPGVKWEGHKQGASTALN